jgi:hypothetical protein
MCVSACTHLGSHDMHIDINIELISKEYWTSFNNLGSKDRKNEQMWIHLWNHQLNIKTCFLAVISYVYIWFWWKDRQSWWFKWLCPKNEHGYSKEPNLVSPKLIHHNFTCLWNFSQSCGDHHGTTFWIKVHDNTKCGLEHSNMA